MTPQQLRNSILQQAIEGKLVEQRAEEGTAEDLYAQIQEEKKKLIAEGKIKKEKPLPEITEDEIPFDIPESWKWVRLSQCIQVNPIVQCDDETEVSFIPMAAVEAGYSSKINIEEKRKWINVKNNFTRFAEHDVLVAKITPCFQNRKSAIAKGLLNNYGAGTTEFNVLRTTELLYNKYVLFFVKSAYFIDYGQDHFTGTAGQQRFGGASLREMLFPLPPLAEQKRIVAKIEELLPFVEKYEKAYNALEEYNARFPEDMRKSILQQAIEGKLVEQRAEEGTAEELYAQIQEEKKKLIAEGKIKKEKLLPEITEEEIPFDIPESWKWLRLSDISEIQSSKRVYEKDYVSKGIPFFRSKEIVDLSKGENIKTELFISLEQYEDFKKKYGVPKKGDILITSVGTLGKTWICDGREFYYKDGNITQIRGNGYFDSKFINYFIQSDLFMKQVIGTVSGTAYNALTIIKLRNIILPFPPLAEQKRIVAKIEELLPYCDKLA